MGGRASGVPGAPVTSGFWFHTMNLFRRLPVYWGIDRLLVRWTGFSVITWLWSRQNGNPMLPAVLLETVGRSSGEIRPNVLPYFAVGDDIVLIGSVGGGPKNPQWVENLRAEPRCWVVERTDRRPFRGRVVVGEEKAQWAARGVHHVALPHYESRAASFGREIPYVVLSPARRGPKVRTARNDLARYQPSGHAGSRSVM